ncbi:MAG: hypothetical protein OEV28_12450 [Nitrospirota bacterium]|nr:hypothetical protein [Nitrospirota bacterium]
MLDRIDATLSGREDIDPLTGIELVLLEILRVVEEDEATRQTFDIMTLKCEYAGDFREVLAQIMKPGNEFTRKLEESYREAKAAAILREGLKPSLLALDTYTFITGLLRLWFSDTEETGMRPHARALIRAHLESRRK